MDPSLQLFAPALQEDDAAPDLMSMGQRFLPEAPTSRIVKRLHALLSTIANVGSLWTLEEQIDWLEQLSDWLHRRGWPSSRRTTSLDLLALRDARTLHLALLVKVLSAVPIWRQAFSQLVRAVLNQMQATLVFSDVGLPQEPGFWREAMARMGDSLLPQPPNSRHLSELLARILPDVEDARWLLRVPRTLFDKFLELLHDNSEKRAAVWHGLRKSIVEALTVLAVRVCALGLANDVRERLPETPLEQLPFLRLQRVCEALLQTAQIPFAAATPIAENGASAELVAVSFTAIADCRQSVQQVLGHLEDFGVSVDLVYRLELINAMLGRIEVLLGLLFARPKEKQVPIPIHEGAHFVAELIQARVQRRSLRALFQTSTNQLARKIVERTGKSGEKYITETPAEWRSILFAGCGAGAVTAGTAMLKFGLSMWSLPAFFAGLLASLNYSVSFVIIQLCHFTLATKQPSMTAAALASAIRGRVDVAQLNRLVDMIVRITRSQVAAALGNIGAVIPTAILVDWLWRLRSGHSFLDITDARHTVDSLHPLRVLPYASLTGVYLWLSSVAAGWLENWAVYHHLPEAIAGSRRLNKLFGKRTTQWFSRALSYHISGVGGVVTLGFLLGMSPVIGQFFGIPSKVCHVTLSSGALTLACCADVFAHGARSLLEHGHLMAGLGILLTLFLNFGVSFALAMWVALRARDVRRKDYMALLGTVLRRMLRSPLEFIFPRSPNARALVSQSAK